MAITSEENKPEYIIEAINKGYDCEIDLWQNENGLFLGHDEPRYSIDCSFITTYNNKLWIHCKNLEALYYCVKYEPFCNAFWHQQDNYTLTTQKYIWTYPNQRVNDNSVLVVNNRDYDIKNSYCYGICSDFVDFYKEKLYNK